MPLPSRTVSKPASAPPSVVDDLTQKLGQTVLPDAGPTSPPTPGLPVETTGIAPSKTKAAETSGVLTSVEPVDEPAAPAAPRRRLSGLIYAAAVLALAAFYYVWSPYHAASLLQNALNEGDPAGLGSAIDFPAVRASLKEQIKNQITQSDSQSRSIPPAGSPLAAALSMIDHSIDLYITPKGLSGLVKKSGPFSKEDLAQAISPEVAANILLALNTQPASNRGLASFGDFVLDKDAVMLHLRFQELGWKLERIDLGPGLRTAASSGAAAPLLSPVVDTYLE